MSVRRNNFACNLLARKYGRSRDGSNRIQGTQKMFKKIIFSAAASVSLLWVGADIASAQSSPTAPFENRALYFPGTEQLGADEMRITSCGTGQPSVRRKQAAACWLVELGNGDKFLFDLGAQSMRHAVFPHNPTYS
jgi:hypothetical protein